MDEELGAVGQSEIVELNLFAQFGLPGRRFPSNLTNLRDISQLYIIPYQYQCRPLSKMMYVSQVENANDGKMSPDLWLGRGFTCN